MSQRKLSKMKTLMKQIFSQDLKYNTTLEYKHTFTTALDTPEKSHKFFLSFFFQDSSFKSCTYPSADFLVLDQFEGI